MSGRTIRDVAHPDPIGPVYRKAPIQQIGLNGQPVLGVRRVPEFAHDSRPKSLFTQ